MQSLNLKKVSLCIFFSCIPTLCPGQFRVSVIKGHYGFHSRADCLEFVVDEVSRGQILLRARWFPLSIIIPPKIHINLPAIQDVEWTNYRPQFHRDKISPNRENRRNYVIPQLAFLPYSFFLTRLS